MLKNSTECNMMNTCNLVEKIKKYFQEVEDARPLASMIHNDRAGILAKEMLLLSISKDIVEGIIHQLLLDYDQDDAEDKIIIAL
jgi:hypothetical protein